MSLVAELSIFPTDKGRSVSSHVARAVEIIRDSGLSYQLNPMGTCIEGEWAEVMELVDRCFKEIQKDSERIYMTLKPDYRKDQSNRMDAKVSSVLEKL